MRRADKDNAEIIDIIRPALLVHKKQYVFWHPENQKDFHDFNAKGRNFVI